MGCHFEKNQDLGTPKGIIQKTIISQLRKTTSDIAQECTLTSVSVIEHRRKLFDWEELRGGHFKHD